MKTLNVEFEKAVRLLMNCFPPSDENSRKPVLFHVIRVGVYLYEKNYSREIVLAGLLHDAIEWSGLTEEVLRREFGNSIVKLILACTKDDSIKDSSEKIEELIRRCADSGEEALIVKSADILDSFKYYTSVKNEGEILYCKRNANAILRHVSEKGYTDGIFEEIRTWKERVS